MTDLQKAREIFGDELRDTHEFIEWLKSHVIKYYSKVPNHSFTPKHYVSLIWDAHNFNSQPFKREWIESPEEPEIIDVYDDPNEWEKNYKLWKSWKSLFKGEWKIREKVKRKQGYFYERPDEDLIIYNGKVVISLEETMNATLNDFLTECKEQGIRVLLND